MAPATDDPFEQTTEDATDRATGRTRRAAAGVRDQALGVVDDLKEHARDFAGDARTRARAAADRQKDAVAEQVYGFASALRSAADDLNQREQRFGAGCFEQVAEGLEQVSEALRRRDLARGRTEVRDDAIELAKLPVDRGERRLELAHQGVVGEQATDRTFARGQPAGHLAEVGKHRLQPAIRRLQLGDQIAGGADRAMDLVDDRQDLAPHLLHDRAHALGRGLVGLGGEHRIVPIERLALAANEASDFSQSERVRFVMKMAWDEIVDEVKRLPGKVL